MNETINIRMDGGTSDEIKKLQERLEQLENMLNKSASPVETNTAPPAAIPLYNRDEEFEMRISQYWLPKFGISAFVLGVIVSLTLPLENIPSFIPVAAGYMLALAVLLLTPFLRKNFPQLFGYILGGSASIAFIATLRLYFFGNENLLSSILLETVFLLFVAASTMWYALKYKSVYLASLSLLFGIITAIISNNALIFFPILIFIALSTVYLKLRYEWSGLLLMGISLTYITLLNWYLKNPFMGNPIDTVSGSPGLQLFILLFMLIFALGVLYRKDRSEEDYLSVTNSFITSACGYGLFLIITLLDPPSLFGFFHLTAASVCMLIAISFWMKERSQYSTFIYAMTAYASLSVAIIFQFGKPDYFIWLSWQSLLVVSTALWFRSKFIVITNTIIFFLVLIAYLISEKTISPGGLSLGVIALIMARIMNWKKDRLELKTDNMRIIFLLIALFWIPYVLYCILPNEFIGLALLALSLFYFGMSKLLKNLKYRWMAIMTLLIMVFFLVIYFVTSQNTILKIISFLTAGIVLIITSAMYSRTKHRKEITGS